MEPKAINGVGGGNDERLERYFTRQEAVHLIREQRGVNIAPKTLTNWAWEGRGPRWTRFGRRSVAKGSEILAAIDAMLTNDTPPQAA
jgi:hypothetical protein